VGRRSILLGALVFAVGLAALLIPQAHSLWFQVLRADSSVDVQATATPTASASPTSSATTTSTATATPTATATASPTMTPTFVAPLADACPPGVVLSFGEQAPVVGAPPYEHTIAIRNTGGDTAEAVLLGLRIDEGAPYAARVDYGNGQYWSLDGEADASNLYLVGDLPPGEHVVDLSLTTGSSWQGAADGEAITIDVVVAAPQCPGEPAVALTLQFVKGEPPEVTATSEAATPQPADDPTETPTSPSEELAPPEVSVPQEPTFTSIDPLPVETGAAAPTMTAAPATSTPRPTSTQPPRPTRTPQPTSTPRPAATVPSAPTTGARTQPTVAADALVELRRQVDGEAAAAAAPHSESPPVAATVTVADVVTSTIAPSPTVTAAATPTEPTGQVLSDEAAPRSREPKSPSTGYEWLGDLGPGTLTLLLAVAAAGFVLLAAGLGRRLG
jgi:hypothetical protein